MTNKEIVLKLHLEGKTVRDIFKQTGISERNARSYINQEGYTVNKLPKIKGIIRKDIIKLNQEGKSVKEISIILNKSDENIRNQLSALGLKSNKIDRSIKKNKILSNVIELNKQGKTIKEISEIINKSENSVYKYHKDLNIKINKEVKKVKEVKEVVVDLSQDVIDRCRKAMEISTKCREWEVAWDNEQYYN